MYARILNSLFDVKVRHTSSSEPFVQCLYNENKNTAMLTALVATQFWTDEQLVK